MNPVCPACGILMQLIQWRDLHGFECSSCRGHVIRAAQLERFLEKHGAGKFGNFVARVRDGTPSPRKLTCPGCATRSFRVLRRGRVEIDVCASCSCVYFDAGEAQVYVRQALVRKFGADAVNTTVDTVDGLGTLLESILDFLN